MAEISKPTSEDGPEISKCPVDYEKRSLWPFGGGDKERKECTSDDIAATPASLEEAAKYAQTPLPGQQLPLATHRLVSSIPRGSGEQAAEPSKPHHQPKDANDANWVYPSEQQVFNAMKRKGWKGIEESSIPSFLQIHNSVNERSWTQLQEWENNQDNIRLVKFEGRPNTMTPKAWLLSTVGLKSKPFDRHDWYIDNGVEHSKRYVLDFYMEESGNAGMPRVDIDVRPALDTPQAVFERAQRVAQDTFPGIAKAVKDWNRTN